MTAREAGDEQEHPGPVEPAKARPGGAGRGRTGAVLTWVAPAAVLAGLVAGSLVAVQARTDQPGNAVVPLGPGTTSVFETTTDGKATGLHYSVVAGPALLVDLPGEPRAVVEADHYDDYDGSGSPLDEMSYEAWRGGELLSYGFRSPSGQFVANTPPEPVLRLGLAAGQGWRWQGKEAPVDSQVSLGMTADWTFVGYSRVRALGRQLAHCGHYRSVTVQSGGGASAPKDIEDTWLCNGLGTVKTYETYEGHVYVGRLVHFSSASRTVTAPGAGEALMAANGVGPATGGTGAGGHGPAPGTPAQPGGSAGPGGWDLYLTGDSDVVADRSVIVTANVDGSVSAIDRRTGEVLWKLALPSPISVAPVLAGGVVLVGDGAKQLHALGVRTGAAQWALGLPDLLAAPPAVKRGVVVVAGQDKVLRALLLSDGTQLWAARLASMPTSAPVITGGVVVVGEEEGALKALALSSGAERWEASLDGLLAAGPVVGDGLVVASDDQGVLYGLDASDGWRRFERYLGPPVDHPPVLGGGRVLAVSGDRRLVALSARDGGTEWSREFPGALTGGVVVVGGRVLVQHEDGGTTWLSLSSGSPMGTARSTAPAGGVVSQPLALSAGELVTALRCQVPYESTYVVASPLVAARTGRPGGGVGFRVSASQVSPPVGWQGPIAPPAGWGAGTVFSGWDQRVWYVAAGGRPSDVAKTGLSFFAVPAGELVLAQRGQYLVALPRHGGRPRWQFPLGGTSLGGPLVAGGLVVFDAGGQGLVALDESTGKPLWFLRDPGQDTSRPLALPGGYIVWTGPGGLVMVDAGTGQAKWSLPSVLSGTSPAFGNGMVFVGAQDKSGTGRLVAVLAASGRTAWTSAPVQLSDMLGPVVADGVVVAPGAGDSLQAWGAATGRPLWSATLRTALDGPLAVIDGMLVAAQRGRHEDLDNQDHTITVSNLRTGGLLGLLQLPGAGSSNNLAQAFGRTGTAELVEYGSPYLYTVRLLR